MRSVFKSLKGQLLLDGGKLAGSFFHRSVVLICQHDQEGAFGLVLNRKSGQHVAESMEAELPPYLREQELYLGGPVQPQALSFLHADAFLAEPSILPNLVLGHSLEKLIEVGGSFSPTRQLRVFAGYAGWSAGQLDEEMSQEAWLLHPATIDLVFDPQPDHLWKQILKEKGPVYRLAAEAPDDPELN